MSFGFQFKNEADDDSVLHKDTNNNQGIARSTKY